MNEGTVKWFNEQKGYGFIKVNGSSEDAFFHFSEWRGSGKPREGQRVRFRLEQELKGPAAKDVWPADMQAGTQANPQKPAQHQEQPETDYFLNPYNFVRYLPPRPNKKNDPLGVQILGQGAPPPHDRWLGLSGRIDCKAKVVTHLFISGAENMSADENENNHRHYHFFQVNGEKRVPASSLRGLIRSLYEAATNSRFGVFETDAFPLEYRHAKVLKGMTPARVLYLTKNGGAVLELLDCKKPADKNRVLNAAWLHAYSPKVRYGPNNANAGSPKLNRRTLRLAEAPAQRVAALVSRQPVTHHSGRFDYYQVKPGSVVAAASHGTLTADATYEIVYGYLHVTGPNIENKHDERLFFRRGDLSVVDHQPNAVGIKQNAHFCPVPAAVVEEYNQRLTEYYERNKKEAGKSKTPANWPLMSKFIGHGRRLKVGDLVYFIKEQRSTQTRTLLRPVSIPRIPYWDTRQSRLPSEYHPAKSVEQLSPAERLFGWVQGEAQEGAYAGRVSLSDGVFETLNTVEEEIVLAILSTPKPTTTRFYLSHKDWKSRKRDHDEAGYDNADNRLRGRKFYRHFGAKQFRADVYKAAWNSDKNDYSRSDQNRTLHGVVAKDSTFRFSITFENLHPIELGALLWCIQLEDGMHHRLGLAKPLGFGSIQIEVDTDEAEKRGLCVLDVVARYNSLGDTGWRGPLTGEQVMSYVTLFKQAIVHRHLPARAGAIIEHDQTAWQSAFEELVNIADLIALLREPTSSLSIHYPRLPGDDGENFKWFMNNKQTRRSDGSHGAWFELEAPAEEASGDGLPRQVSDRVRD